MADRLENVRHRLFSLRLRHGAEVVDLDQHGIVDIAFHRCAAGKDVVLFHDIDVGRLLRRDLLRLDIQVLALALVDDAGRFVNQFRDLGFS